MKYRLIVAKLRRLFLYNNLMNFALFKIIVSKYYLKRSKILANVFSYCIFAILSERPCPGYAGFVPRAPVDVPMEETDKHLNFETVMKSSYK